MADLKLPSLTTPSFSVPNLTTGRIKTPKLTTIGPVAPRYKRAQKQTRHVTDLGDLLLGNPITGTRQLQETLKDNNLGELVYVPILNRLVGAGLMVQERIISPVLKGDVDDALINILESFSGTLDTLANPIKSLLPFAGGGTAEDFLKSMGWLDGAYREQYQWNTGNTVLDLLGEMVSDPANWFTFGGAGAAKQASKGISKEITSELIERYGREVIDDINLARVLSKLSPEKLFETTADLTTDNSKLVKLISNNITEQREYYLKELAKLKKGTRAYNKTAALLKQYNTLYANIDDVSTVIAKARNSKWYNVYKQAVKYEKIGDAIDKELFKAAAMLTGTYVPATILIKQLTPRFKAIYSKATKSLAKVTPTDLTGNPAKVHKQIMREVRASNEAMYSYHFDTFKNRIKYFLGSDEAANNLIINLRKICHDVIEDNNFDITNRTAINNEFIRRAVKYEPRLKTVFNKKLATRYDKFLAEWSYDPNALDVQKLISDSELVEYANPDAFIGVVDELDPVSLQVVDAIVDESYMDKMLTLTEIQKFKDEIDNRMRQLFKTEDLADNKIAVNYLDDFNSNILPKVGTLLEIPDLDLLKFADNYLEILTKLSKLDHTLFLNIVHFKDYLGITKSNIKIIARLFKNIQNAKQYLMRAQGSKLLKELQKTVSKSKVILDLERTLKNKYTAFKQAVESIYAKQYIKKADAILKQMPEYDVIIKLNPELILKASNGSLNIASIKTELSNYNVMLKLANHPELIKLSREYQSDINQILDSFKQTITSEYNYQFLTELNKVSKSKQMHNALLKSNPKLTAKINKAEKYIQSILTASAKDDVYVNVNAAIKELNSTQTKTSKDFIERIEKEYIPEATLSEQELKVFEDAAKETYKTVEVYKEDLTKSLEDLLNDYSKSDLDILYESIDDVFDYAGTDEYSFTIKEYLNTLLDPATDYVTYRYTLDELKSLINKLNVNIKKYSKPNIPSTIVEEYDGLEFVNNVKEQLYKTYPTKEARKKVGLTINVLPKDSSLLVPLTGRYPYKIKDSVVRVTRNNFYNPDVALSFLTDLRNILNSEPVTMYIGDFDKILKSETNQKIYVEVMSKMERTRYIENSILTDVDHEFLVKLMGHNSDYRKSINEVINKLIEIGNNTGDKSVLSYARSIKMTLLKLESMTLMHDCLNMPYIDAMDITKELKNLAHGYTFSALTSPAYAGKHIDAVTETDIKNILKDIKTNLSKSYKNQHYKELGLPKKDIDDFVKLKELEDKIKYSELYDLTDDEYDRYYAKYEELKEALATEDLEKFNRLNNLIDVDWQQTGANIVSDMMVEIETNIKRYATSLRNFSDTNNLPQVKLFNIFEKTSKYSDITNLNLLGENYDAIMELLTNSGTAPKVIEDTTDYILNTAGARIKTDVEKAHRSLINRLVKEGNIPYSKIPQEYVDRQIGELTSIADAISKGYRDIGKLNEQKRGNAGLLGKLYRQKNGTLKIHNITRYVAEDAIRNVITENTALSNIFEMSNAYNNIAWKRINLYQNTSVFDNFFSEDLLSYRSPKAENMFKLGFSEIIEDVNPNAYSKDYINIIKQTLIDYYNTVATDVVPKNVGAYFNKLNKRELITWHRYTGGLYTTKTGQYRTMLNNNYNIIKAAIKDEYDDASAKVLQGKISKANELSKVRTRYEQLLSTVELDEEATNFDIAIKEISDKVQPEEESFERIVANSPAHRYPRIIKELSNSVDKPFKSLDEAYAASHTLSELAKQDSTATARLKVISDVANDERIFKDVYPELFEEYKDVLRSYYIDATTKMNDKKLQRLAKHSLEHNLYESVLAFNPTELRAFIDHNTDGIMLMHDPSRTFLSKYTEEELTAAGIRYMEHSTSTGYYLVCRTDQTMHDATLSFKTYAEDSLIGVLTKPIRDMHKANQYYYHLDGMYFDMDLFTGDMLKREVYNDILNVKEFREFIGDDRIQKSYRKINNSKENLFHIKNVDRPNLTIIGYEDPVNNFISQFSRHLSNKTNTYGYLPTRFDSAALSGSTQAITRWNTEHKYGQIFFTNDFSLDAPMFKQVLDNATDEELKQFFARNNFSACVLVRDSHNRPVVRKIFIENKEQLKAAREMEAVCLPHELYRNATLTINKHKVTSKFVNACRLLLESTFKTVYLTNPGFLMRNFFDSAIYKNLAATDGMSSFVDNFKYYYRAQKMLEEYDSIIRAATADGVFNQRSINKVFQELSPDKQQMYLLMDMYMNTGASGGLTESLEDFFIRYNKKHGEVSPTYNWAAWYRDNILNNGYTRFIQNINNKIEQTSRLALFLNLLDNGDEFTSAVTKVINTHFDYSLKMQGLEWLENIFWFSTFPINNVMFYLNEGLTKNPELLKLQLDLAELSWNDQENYTWEDVRRSNYLTYNALVGNVRIKVQDKNIVIKTGSSVFDFMNVFLNPVGEAADRLSPFIAVPLGLKETEQLNPLNSVVSKINQIKNKQSYLPSVYTTLYPKYEYKYKPYQKRYYSSWSPKVRRPYVRKASSVSKQMAYRAYKFYTRRFYTRKNYNPLNRRIRYLAVFDEKRGRYARAAARYSRQMKQVHRK